MDLREDADGLPGAVIPGTERTRNVPSTATGAQKLSFTVDPPINLPGKIWITFQIHASGTRGWVLTRLDAAIGGTDARYAHSRAGRDCASVNDWETLNLPDPTAHGGFDATITCAGQPPIGACCDMFVLDDADEAVCREVPQMNCPTSRLRNVPAAQALWVRDTTCQLEPFAHACGLSACCKPDDTCENLTQNQCIALYGPGEVAGWQRLQFCREQEQVCPYYHCVQGHSGPCAVGHDGPGCEVPQCCQEVSDGDPWCAQVEWDRVCLRESVDRSYCGYYAPPSDWCAPDPGPPAHGAMTVDANFSMVLVNEGGTTIDEPGFSCHSGFPAHCVGGFFDGLACEEPGDCGFGTCVPQTPMPGQRGAGTLWFSFVATHSSSRVSTCSSDPAVDDTLIAVHRAADPDPERACDTLVPVACADDSPSCGASRNAAICAKGLTPGDTYYIQVADKLSSGTGVLQLDVESPCPHGSPSESTGIAADVSDGGIFRTSATVASRVERIDARTSPPLTDVRPLHREVPGDPPMPRPATAPAGAIAHSGPWVRGPYVSVQVNVDAEGNNIVGDAANEPSIAIDPTNADKIVIGWRQFDTIESDFRQGGYAYSHNGGATWNFPGVLEAGVFRSDPVLDSDAAGVFYYYSLHGDTFTYDLFRSFDGGVTWAHKTFAYGGDKGWMVVDKSDGPGRGALYGTWTGFRSFARSTDGGQSFTEPISIPGSPQWGTMAVGARSELYVIGDGGVFTRSSNAWDPNVPPTFASVVYVDLGGSIVSNGQPNPGGGSSGGLLGHMWVATGRDAASITENVYVLASVSNKDPNDPLDVMFSRSTDGGRSWSPASRVNDDPPGEQSWQWFGTISVAPSGRIDAVWNDTRNSRSDHFCETSYAYSVDGGRTWSKNVAVSPMWDSWIGWPHANYKIGDYYHMISDDRHAKLAYAATFNGEQDVYFLKIPPTIDCNHNGVTDADDLADGTSPDCIGNGVPDECEQDFDGDGIADSCDDDVDGDGVANAADVCLFTTVDTRVDETGRPTGDTNRNCALDLVDFWRFRNCMVNGRLGAPAPREACLAAFDVNGDERLDLRDAAVFLRSFGGEP